MAFTNAQAALIAAAEYQGLVYSKGAPSFPSHMVTAIASDFKKWLDASDERDAADQRLALKGSVEERLTRLEDARLP